MTKQQAFERASAMWFRQPTGDGHAGQRCATVFLGNKSNPFRYRVGYLEYLDARGSLWRSVELGRSSVSWEDAFDRASKETE